MEIETLTAMNGGIYPGLLTMMEVIGLITIFFAVTAFVISLASIAWLCFEETRQPVRRQTKPALKSAESGEQNPLAALTALNKPGRRFSGHRVAPRIGVSTDFN